MQRRDLLPSVAHSFVYGDEIFNPTHNATETSLEENNDSFNETKPTPNTSQASEEDYNIDYVIKKVVGYKRAA